MAARYWVGGTASWDATVGTKWALTSNGAGGQAVPTYSDTVFFDASSGASTVTIASGTATCSTLTMTGFTGTLAFGTNSITCAGTGTVYTGATGFSVTGTPLINLINSSSTARTINPTATTEANSISFTISAGSGSVTVTQSTRVKNLIFSGTFAGTLANTSRTIYGDLTFKTGMSINQSAPNTTTTFAATSGTQNITSAGLNLNFSLTFSGSATYRLLDNLSVGTSASRLITFNIGTLDLNGFTLTLYGAVYSTTTDTRTIAFGSTGNFTITTGGTIWDITDSTGLSITGTPVVNLTYSGALGTRNIQHGNFGEGTESIAISFNITAGTDYVVITGSALNLNWTGFNGTMYPQLAFVYGNLTIPSGPTNDQYASYTFASTSATTRTITTNNVTFSEVWSFEGVGGSWQLQDNATIVGGTGQLNLISGTLDLNGKTLTVGFFVVYTTGAGPSGTKNLTFNGGILECQRDNTYAVAFDNQDPTGFSTTAGTGVGTITLTAPLTKSFTGGDSTFNCTLNQGGAGDLLIIGNNTFNNITNTVQPASVLFTAGTTNTFNNFNLTGTAGNLITIGSDTAATHTLSKSSGTVSGGYLSISDSTATGGGTWYAGANSTDSGNNTGWLFINQPISFGPGIVIGSGVQTG